MRNVFLNAETTELSGKCIVGLAKGEYDGNKLSLSGNYAGFH